MPKFEKYRQNRHARPQGARVARALPVFPKNRRNPPPSAFHPLGAARYNYGRRPRSSSTPTPRAPRRRRLPYLGDAVRLRRSPYMGAATLFPSAGPGDPIKRGGRLWDGHSQPAQKPSSWVPCLLERFVSRTVECAAVGAWRLFRRFLEEFWEVVQWRTVVVFGYRVKGEVLEVLGVVSVLKRRRNRRGSPGFVSKLFGGFRFTKMLHFHNFEIRNAKATSNCKFHRIVKICCEFGGVLHRAKYVLCF